VGFAAHEQSVTAIQGAPGAVFDYLDDPKRLGAHMEKPSAVMLGGNMRYAFDSGGGRTIGSVIAMQGSVAGLDLDVEEVVTERSPSRKIWETRGEPHLLIIGAYRMGFDIEPAPAGAKLTVFIDYDLPRRGLQRVLGAAVGRLYARWCVSRMAKDAARHFQEFDDARR